MNNGKPVYKLIDEKGRVYIPKDFRMIANVECGDIVKLTTDGGNIGIKKVALIEIGDQSPEAVEAFVEAAINVMDREKKIELINRLCQTLRSTESVAGNTII